MNRAAFFDRDGTINVDFGYVYEPEKLEFVKGVPELIRSYNERDFLVIVISNQSGIARGMYSEDQMHRFNAYMNGRLEAQYGARIDAFYFCPHLPELSGECDCRKPKPGLFLRAMREHDIDPASSVSYGDALRDEIASRAAGIPRFYYIQGDPGMDI